MEKLAWVMAQYLATVRCIKMVKMQQKGAWTRWEHAMDQSPKGGAVEISSMIAYLCSLQCTTKPIKPAGHILSFCPKALGERCYH